MQVKYFKQGSSIFPRKVDEDSVRDSIPAGVYMIKRSDEGYFIETICDRFTLPEKVYGQVEGRSERVIDEFLSKEGSCGIILTGAKGTGKTLQSKDICNKLMDRGLPVFLVNASYTDNDFFTLLENLGMCVVLFDEFGKVYNSFGHEDTQSKILPILDGLTQGKRLHIMTDNQTDAISNYILGRPGRATYHFKYGRLEDAVIREYCEDKEVPDAVIKEILSNVSRIPDMSMDNLIALVHEWKKYKEPIKDILTILNIGVVGDLYVYNVVRQLLDGRGNEVKWAKGLILKTREARPQFILKKPTKETDESGDDDGDFFNLGPSSGLSIWGWDNNIVKIEGNVVTYQDDSGYILTVEKVEKPN